MSHSIHAASRNPAVGGMGVKLVASREQAGRIAMVKNPEGFISKNPSLHMREMFHSPQMNHRRLDDRREMHFI